MQLQPTQRARSEAQVDASKDMEWVQPYLEEARAQVAQGETMPLAEVMDE